MMGGQADSTEDMFSKLESMRAVITEVNTQFKDPVSVLGGPVPFLLPFFFVRSWSRRFSNAGKNHVRLRVHIRIPVTIRDRASGTGTYRLRNRHAQHCSESASVSQGR